MAKIGGREVDISGLSLREIDELRAREFRKKSADIRKKRRESRSAKKDSDAEELTRKLNGLITKAKNNPQIANSGISDSDIILGLADALQSRSTSRERTADRTGFRQMADNLRARARETVGPDIGQTGTANSSSVQLANLNNQIEGLSQRRQELSQQISSTRGLAQRRSMRNDVDRLDARINAMTAQAARLQEGGALTLEGQRDVTQAMQSQRVQDLIQQGREAPSAMPEQLQRPETLRELEALARRGRAAVQQGMEGTPEEARATALVNQRFIQALEGNLPVNPALRKEFEDREKVLRANLQRQLGPGYETSSAGIEALSRFNEARSNTFETARRQDINNFASLAQAREQIELQRAEVGLSAGQLQQSGERIQNERQALFSQTALGVRAQDIQREAQRLQEIAALESSIQGKVSVETQERIAQIQAAAQRSAAASAAGATVTAAGIRARTAESQLAFQREQLGVQQEQFSQEFGLKAATTEENLSLQREESEFNRALNLGKFQLNAQNTQFQQSLQLNEAIINQEFAERNLENMDFQQIAALSEFTQIPLSGFSGGAQTGMGAIAGLSDQRKSELQANIATAENNTELLTAIIAGGTKMAAA